MKKNILTNYIKFFAAILVIFSHAFSLSQNKCDIFEKYNKKSGINHGK